MNDVPRAERRTEDLGRAVGDDLIRVHVGGRAGPGLVDVDDELVVELAVGNLERRLLHRLGLFRFEPFEVGVGLRRGPLDQTQGPDHAACQPQLADREVDQGPLRRGAVVGILRHCHLTHRVAFEACLHGGQW